MSDEDEPPKRKGTVAWRGFVADTDPVYSRGSVVVVPTPGARMPKQSGLSKEELNLLDQEFEQALNFRGDQTEQSNPGAGAQPQEPNSSITHVKTD